MTYVFIQIHMIFSFHASLWRMQKKRLLTSFCVFLIFPFRMIIKISSAEWNHCENCMDKIKDPALAEKAYADLIKLSQDYALVYDEITHLKDEKESLPLIEELIELKDSYLAERIALAKIVNENI